MPSRRRRTLRRQPVVPPSAYIICWGPVVLSPVPFEVDFYNVTWRW